MLRQQSKWLPEVLLLHLCTYAQVDGQDLPYELVYSRWLTDWASKLTADGNPVASEELMIVARGQHVQRWTVPRSSYPEVR